MLVPSAYCQDEVNVLIDSLAQVSSVHDRSEISLKIASKLVNEDWERALLYMDLARKNAEKSDSERTLAEFYYGLGDIYLGKDALDIALEHYLKAYEFFSKQPVSERFKLENNLAIVYARTANEEKALQYFKRVFEYQKERKDTLILAQILNNMGTLLLKKQVDSSIVYFKRSMQLARKIKNSNLDVFLYTNLGRCYVLKDSTRKAKLFFNRAISRVDEGVNPRNVAWLYNEVSEFYLKNGMADSSLYLTKKAVKSLDSLAPFSFEHQRAVGLLYRSYLAKDEFKEAATYFEKYNSIVDTLNLEDKRINVEKLLIAEKYRAEKRFRELAEGKKRARNYIILLGLLAVLLFCGLLLIRFRNKLKNAELEKQLVTAKQKELNSNLQLKNKELIGKAMVEIHRTEIIEEILQDLKEVKRKAAKKETQNAIDFIAKRLKRGTSNDIWKEFELRFEQVHESFYQNLLAKHPDITSRDKRLCALLKLSLTSKEIAQITGQTAKTVENARTRLRKKLGLTNSQADLSHYLSSLG